MPIVADLGRVRHFCFNFRCIESMIAKPFLGSMSCIEVSGRRRRKCKNRFIFAVAVLLFAGGITNIWTALIANRVLNVPEVLTITDRFLFYILGSAKIIVSGFILATDRRHEPIKLFLIAWISGGLLVYRVWTYFTNNPDMFSCVGSLTDEVPIHPRVMDALRLAFYGDSLLAVCGLLIADRIKNRRIIELSQTQLNAPQMQSAENH